jgi:hypothetical protein
MAKSYFAILDISPDATADELETRIGDLPRNFTRIIMQGAAKDFRTFRKPTQYSEIAGDEANMCRTLPKWHAKIRCDMPPTLNPNH